MVEAPARSVELLIFDGVTCIDLLSSPPESLSSAGRVVATRTAGYPIDPELKLLDDVPKGSPLAFHLSVFDANAELIARSCTEQTLNASETNNVEITLSGLPQCPDVPIEGLDLALVLDTSTEMSFADPEQQHLGLLGSALIDALPASTRFTLITHGHTDATEQLALTANKTDVNTALSSLVGAQANQSRLYDAVSLAAKRLRANSVCGRKPALLSLQAGLDLGSNTPLELAQIGLFATVGDETDDIFTYGIGVTDNARLALNELVPVGVGDVVGALTIPALNQALTTARLELVELLPNP